MILIEILGFILLINVLCDEGLARDQPVFGSYHQEPRSYLKVKGLRYERSEQNRVGGLPLQKIVETMPLRTSENAFS